MPTPDTNALHQSIDAVLTNKDGMIAERDVMITERDARITQIQAELEREQALRNTCRPVRIEEDYLWLQRLEAFMALRLAFLLGRHFGKHGQVFGPLLAADEANRSQIKMLSSTAVILAMQGKPQSKQGRLTAELIRTWELPDSETRDLPATRMHWRAKGLLLRLVYKNAKRHVTRYY